MKLSKAKLAELKRMGYYVEDQDTDAMTLVAVPEPQEKPAAPEETIHTSPKKWTFSVVRDEFGYIKDIEATQII